MQEDEEARKPRAHEPEEEGRGGAPGQSGGRIGPAPAVARAAAAVGGGGRPLSRSERAWVEPRLGRDLSPVRIHDDAAAGAAARGINARAYTLRNHIAFAPGAYDAGSAEGRRLLAHELVHTIQQGRDEAPRPSRAGMQGRASRLGARTWHDPEASLAGPGRKAGLQPAPLAPQSRQGRPRGDPVQVPEGRLRPRGRAQPAVHRHYGLQDGRPRRVRAADLKRPTRPRDRQPRRDQGDGAARRDKALQRHWRLGRRRGDGVLRGRVARNADVCKAGERALAGSLEAPAIPFCKQLQAFGKDVELGSPILWNPGR